MNLYQLKAFYFTAKFKSISKAAEALFVTQPAVTWHIQQLQKYYDLKFINRVGREIILTDAGEILYSIIEKIFEIENQAEESIRDLQHLKSGYIRILTSESFGAYYLPYIITYFNKLYPEICLYANILPIEEVVLNTAKLNNDLGFISYPVKHNKLVVKEFLEDNLTLITHPGHPLTKINLLKPHDLDGYQFIMHEKGSATRTIVDNFIKDNNISAIIKYELSNNEAIKRLVEQGAGISLISKNVASEELQYGRLVTIPLDNNNLRRKFYMIRHKNKYISKSLQAFIDITTKWSSLYTKALS